MMPHSSRRKPAPGEGSRGRAAAHTAAGVWIWGRHAVEAALANPARKVLDLVATAAAVDRAGLADGVRPVRLVLPDAITQLLPEGAVHQGIAALVAPLEPGAIEPILDTRRGPLLMLDQVSDPQNVGAILRSCAAFGAPALIQQDRKAPPMTGALVKAAAGAAERVQDVRVVNLAQALDAAGEAGWLTVGLEGEGTLELADALDDARPVLLVLGAEGHGLRDLVAARCERRARIAIHSAMESLNVSAAAAIALYEATRRRGAGEAARALVERYLAALETRDLETASALLAPRAVLTFPGDVRFEALDAMVAWSATRYRRVRKTDQRWTVAEDGARVYVEGTLFGEALDGRMFSGVRFIDRFELKDGRIARQSVWNDLAEDGVTERA
jgi:23S rRNA (guanosine2251-2'-O)-methyltransferase